MAATIAHEINNPLEAIAQPALSPNARATDPEQIGFLNAAEIEVTRVSHIAKQTLGYYRDPSGRPRLSLRSRRGRHPIYEPRCNAANIAIERHLEPSPDIVVRKGEIMQVISNLITNAIYAMPEGGTPQAVIRHRHGNRRPVFSSPSRTPASASPRKHRPASSTPSLPPASISAPASASSSPGNSSKATAAKSKFKAAPAPDRTAPRCPSICRSPASPPRPEKNRYLPPPQSYFVTIGSTMCDGICGVAVNALSRRNEVGCRRLIDARHKLLRIAVDHRKPRRLHLHHDAVSLQKHVVVIAQRNIPLLRLIAASAAAGCS